MRTQSYAPFNQPENNGGQLQSIQVQGPTSTLLNLSYQYDSYGNLKTLTDGSTSSPFTYDDQNRLTSAYDKNYAYDPAGRLTTYEDVPTTQDANFPVHAQKNPGYSYDANGNLITRNGQTLTWDVENHLQSVTGAGVDEQYRYDEPGKRIAKTSNGSGASPTDGETTVYVSPAYEVSNGVATTYYSFNGQRVALRKGSGLTYLHADHLGSTLLATDSSGNVVDNNQPRYFAYGRERTASLAALPTDYTFTGQKQDGSGLVYMNARYYDPQTGQFISPDTEVPDATNLLAYNRYLYSFGNPLKFTDPTGHDPCDMSMAGKNSPVLAK